MRINANNHETLIIYENKASYINDSFMANNVDTRNLFRPINKILKVIRRFHNILRLPLYSIWYDKETIKEISNYKLVILFATILNQHYVKMHNKLYPNIKLVYWFWNPVRKQTNPIKLKKITQEIWSFDENDCKKYGLKFNNQFFFENLLNNNYDKSIEFDCVFIGKDKNRSVILNDLDKELRKFGLLPYIRILKDNSTKISNDSITNQYINYDEVIKIQLRSKCIIDIVAPGQTGLTLRPLEAIFFNKKLLTNDSSIQQRDFYTKNNIFVLGKDNIDDISLFINSDFETINPIILQKYTFKQWLEKFSK